MKLNDIAGTWKMSDKELKNFLKDLRERWKSWKIKIF